MIAAALGAAWLSAALPAAVEPVRHRRFIVIARARPPSIETPSAPRDGAIVMLRTGPDPDAPNYGPVATFDARWRALQGY